MTQLILPRRKFLTGALAFIAAPAIVRASSLMPIKVQGLTLEEAYRAEILALGYRESLLDRPTFFVSPAQAKRFEDANIFPGSVNWVVLDTLPLQRVLRDAAH